MSLTAKQVIKNKFWIVEKDGNKIATIQTTPTGVTLVQDEKREQFASINLLKSKYNIAFDKAKATRKPAITFDVNGYPCDHRPYNALFNVAKKLPVYTKTDKSKSFFCAGHYLVKFSLGYVHAYCPKLITLNRYEFFGPFPTKAASKEYSKSLKKEA
jgi:hypothetical protein